MAASVNLVYNASRGTASYSWDGSTLVVRARALTNYGLTLISVQCDQENDVVEEYDHETGDIELRSSGHTVCSHVEVRVIFAPVDEDLAILYIYAQTVGIGGKITPAEQEKVFDADSTTSVRATFTITPDKGYQLDRLVNEYGTVVSTSTSSTINVTINVDVEPGYVGHRTYFAYFTPIRYKYALDVEYLVKDDDVPVESGGTNRKSSGMANGAVTDDSVMRERLYYRSGSSYRLYDEQGNDVPRGSDHPFAYLIGSPKLVTVDDTLTVTLDVPAGEAAALWELLGLQLMGWHVRQGGLDSGKLIATFPADGNSVTIDLSQYDIDFSGSTQNVKFSVYAVICSASAARRITFSCVPSKVGFLSIRTSYRDYSARGTVTCFAMVGQSVVLAIESVEGMGDGWFIHGWSEQLPNASMHVGDVAAKSYTMPDHDSRVTVYFCTHRLLHGTDGSLLHGAQHQLLYDCNVPPGTTVYD